MPSVSLPGVQAILGMDAGVEVTIEHTFEFLRQVGFSPFLPFRNWQKYQRQKLVQNSHTLKDFPPWNRGENLPRNVRNLFFFVAVMHELWWRTPVYEGCERTGDLPGSSKCAVRFCRTILLRQ